MDWKALEVQAILGLVPVVTMIVVYYVRLLMPKIPRAALPFIALLLPYVVAIVTNAAAGTDLDPVVAALLGGCATWLREVLNTLREHGAGA